MYRGLIKPMFDFLAALILLILLSPVITLLVIMLSFANNGKPFFFQRRIGYKNRPFYVVKFKTMNDRRDSNGELLPDRDRLTTVGLLVRKTSLDELPQLFNVLKFDMSLVGPRPLLPEYLPLYDDTQIRRHEVKPGITGWAQVNGRNAISWKQKFELDVWYVDHQNIGLDIRILGMTVKKVITTEGINAENTATMDRFTGN